MEFIDRAVDRLIDYFSKSDSFGEHSRLATMRAALTREMRTNIVIFVTETSKAIAQLNRKAKFHDLDHSPRECARIRQLPPNSTIAQFSFLTDKERGVSTRLIAFQRGYRPASSIIENHRLH